ncbi:DUF6086 family protein [Amycolatopsis sp. NPDC059657]|uniref:DUF6086 family protein n=1 Tax=Amycolatopsis sp. NPDC059657 TaxID=3346899 RepID=UPI00366F5B12
MSYVFAVGDDVIWDPALRVGKLFIAIADSLGDHDELKGVRNGLSMMTSDYYNVNPQELADYMRAVLTSSVVRNRAYKELSRGFIVACLVMLERAGVTIEPVNDSQRDLFEAKSEMMRAM